MLPVPRLTFPTRIGSKASFVPTGLASLFYIKPSVKTLGYFLFSYVESRVETLGYFVFSYIKSTVETLDYSPQL